MDPEKERIHRHRERFGLLNNKLLVVFIMVLMFALGVLAWKSKWFSGNRAVRVPALVSNPPSVDELTSNLANTVDSLGKVFETIQDESTANSALGSIEEATNMVISWKLDRLPENYKTDMMNDVKPMVWKLVGSLKRLYKIPGVQAIIEPAVSPLLSRLQAFANVAAD
ncbi:MAG: hypothetical protein ABL921_19710 [Pirellula sp.]